MVGNSASHMAVESPIVPGARAVQTDLPAGGLPVLRPVGRICKD